MSTYPKRQDREHWNEYDIRVRNWCYNRDKWLEQHGSELSDIMSILSSTLPDSYEYNKISSDVHGIKIPIYGPKGSGILGFTPLLSTYFCCNLCKKFVKPPLDCNINHTYYHMTKFHNIVEY